MGRIFWGAKRLAGQSAEAGGRTVADVEMKEGFGCLTVERTNENEGWKDIWKDHTDNSDKFPATSKWEKR